MIKSQKHIVCLIIFFISSLCLPDTGHTIPSSEPSSEPSSDKTAFSEKAVSRQNTTFSDLTAVKMPSGAKPRDQINDIKEKLESFLEIYEHALGQAYLNKDTVRIRSLLLAGAQYSETLKSRAQKIPGKAGVTDVKAALVNYLQSLNNLQSIILSDLISTDAVKKAFIKEEEKKLLAREKTFLALYDRLGHPASAKTDYGRKPEKARPPADQTVMPDIADGSRRQYEFLIKQVERLVEVNQALQEETQILIEENKALKQELLEFFQKDFYQMTIQQKHQFHRYLQSM